MKEKISKEKILEYFEKESGDRLLDRVEYAERVIFPAMEQYARQFLNPIVTDNVFELIGQGIFKINRCEMTIGGLANEVEKFIDAEVEKRIKERMPSMEERVNMAIEYVNHKSLHKANKGLIKDAVIIGMGMMLSRLTNNSQNT